MAQRPPLTIAEAAQALAVSDKTIRRMLKSGLLHEQARDAGGRILIAAQSIEVAAAQLQRKAIAWPDAPVSAAGGLAPYAQADPLQQLADTFADLIREKDARIYELQDELATLRAELRYLPRLSETERARIAELETALAQAQAEITRLLASGQPTGHTSTQSSEGFLMRQIRRLLGRG